MIYEYLIDIVYTDTDGDYLGGDYPYNRIEWGENEYDALNSLVEKCIYESAKENIKVKFHLSRVRPTGRERFNKFVLVEPYVTCDERPYIKGLITRFMNRFRVSDSIVELEKYKNQFEEYLLVYKKEFPEHVLAILYDQYEKQKTKIESGIIKSISYNIPPFNADTEKGTTKIELINHLANILKRFGFDIRKRDNKYLVRIPEFYKTKDLIDCFGDKQTYEMDPFDLILMWRDNIKEWSTNKDRDFYGISEEDTTFLIFLGNAHDVFREDYVLQALFENEITSYSFFKENEYMIVAITPDQIKTIEPLLPIICEKLLVSQYDLPKYFDESSMVPFKQMDVDDIRGGGGSCIFCGGGTGGGTLCSDCSNNID